MNVAYLLTGGNIGDRLQTITAAKKAIEQYCGNVTNASSVYETEAWGITDQEKFLNQGLELKTELNAQDLLQCILRIERWMGRKREIKYGPRIIDIDILLFNDDVINLPSLTVPHPEMQNRRFALQCLADIAGDKLHPVLHKSIAQLLIECLDTLAVHKIVW